MPKKIALRISSYFILAASVLALPWWCSLFLAAIFLFYFENYFEVIFFAFLMDAFFAIPASRYYGVILVASVSATVFFFAVNFLKKRLLFY